MINVCQGRKVIDVRQGKEAKDARQGRNVIDVFQRVKDDCQRKKRDWCLLRKEGGIF